MSLAALIPAPVLRFAVIVTLVVGHNQLLFTVTKHRPFLATFGTEPQQAPRLLVLVALVISGKWGLSHVYLPHLRVAPGTKAVSISQKNTMPAWDKQPVPPAADGCFTSSTEVTSETHPHTDSWPYILLTTMKNIYLQKSITLGMWKNTFFFFLIRNYFSLLSET